MTPAGGALYVFTRTDGVWSQQEKLVADDAVPGTNLGMSVAIDRNDVVGLTGLFGGGAGYVFSRSGSLWVQRNKFAPSDGAMLAEGIGFDVDLQNGTAVAGARNPDNVQTGRVYVFENAVPDPD